MRTIVKLGALLCAAGLAGCGGGAGESAPMPAPRAAIVAADRCTDASEAAGDYLQVAGECLRSSAVLGRPKALVAQAVASSLTPAQLFDWAEAHYPQYFPTANKSDGTFSPYTYRYYPNTGNYLGVSTGSATDVAIYVFGPVSNGQIARIAALSDYTCTVLPESCAPPAAPTIQSATAANASAVIAFDAPSSSGGSAITQYNARCVALSALMATATGTASPITIGGMSNGSSYACNVSATNSYGTGSPSMSLSVTPSASTNNTQTTSSTSTTTTAGVYCGYAATVYNNSPSVRLTSTVSITCSSTQRVLAGNGVPDHETGSFPNANNPNTISAQSYTFTASITPAVTSTFTAVPHVVGYANNSVPFDPATAESYQNAGVWTIEAIQSYVNLGLDTSLAHVQPNGAYHYHGIPAAYVAKQNKGTQMTLVGWAMDGFPVYANYGFITAMNALSGTRKMAPSWRPKTMPDAGRPSTTSVPMGTFTQDYEYVARLGDLDECNGRFGVTPEFPSGIYHYFLTESFPYIQRCVYGAYTAAPGGPAPPAGAKPRQ